MKKNEIFYVIIILSNTLYSQIFIEPVNSVSDGFKKRYYSQKREYNPLHVGNVWQYRNTESGTLLTTRIVQDSVIYGKKYFKKTSYQLNGAKPNFVSWERNDTVSGVSFMLDFEDVNTNGNFIEELPLDSLENPYWSRYITYKYSFPRPNPFTFAPGQKTVLVKDTGWVKIEADTLIKRRFEILELFWQETIIDKIGVQVFMLEGPNTVCTGAIINGKKYGTIVGVKENEQVLPYELKLENNFPNPFNPSTTINYTIPISQKSVNQYSDVKLIVYDTIGREIAVLINEKKSSGTYSVKFDSKNLSSGVYYYSLITDLKRITKSMVLIK